MPKPSPIVRYRIRNWRAYNRALINRGRLTVWFDEQTIAGWRHTAPATGPGAPRRYADLAIECALVFKSVYPLSLRAAQGFLSSVGEVMKLALSIPDYSTVSRRQGVLQVPVFALPQSSPRHAVSDATGLRVYGAGEWEEALRSQVEAAHGVPAHGEPDSAVAEHAEAGFHGAVGPLK